MPSLPCSVWQLQRDDLVPFCPIAFPTLPVVDHDDLHCSVAYVQQHFILVWFMPIVALWRLLYRTGSRTFVQSIISQFPDRPAASGARVNMNGVGAAAATALLTPAERAGR